MNSPCLGCEERHLGCHGKCMAYLKYKKDTTEENELRRKHSIENGYRDLGRYMMYEKR